MKKGFTLVELLATITILGIIALLLVPTVTETLASFRQDSSESQKKTIVSAAKLWASDHRIDLPSTEGDSVCVKVSQLKQGYLEEDLKDPDKNKLFQMILEYKLNVLENHMNILIKIDVLEQLLVHHQPIIQIQRIVRTQQIAQIQPIVRHHQKHQHLRKNQLVFSLL